MFQEADPKMIPHPGGKVWIKKRACDIKFSKFRIKDHEHAQHQMVDSLPDFKTMEKKMAGLVVNCMLNNAVSVAGSVE